MKATAIFLICCVSLCCSVHAQEKKLSRKEKKALRLEDAKKSKTLLMQVAESEQWVIEANTLYNKVGESFQLNTNINFFAVEDQNGTFQLSFENLIGWNGLGGITLDGKVTKYSVKEGNEKQPITIKYRANGAVLGNVDVLITINSSGMAQATLNGNWGERITIHGRFVALSQSSVYKGSSLN